MFQLLEVIAFMMHLMNFSALEYRARSKIPVFLKRNNAFFEEQLCGYYLTPILYFGATLVTVRQSDVRMLGIVGFSWFYDAERNLLTHCDSKLCVTLNSPDWSLKLEECGGINQEFIYDQSSSELFWKNPETQKLHVIYIQQDEFDLRAGESYRCFVAVNGMHSIESFEVIASIEQRKRMWNKMTAFSLSKYEQTGDLSSETVQNWLGNIESFAHHNVTFGLFKTKEGGYLISDGQTLTIANAAKFEESEYECYGLWKIDPVKRYLIHYLSGKCVTAIHPDSSKGIQQFRQQGIFNSNSTEHYRVLQLSDSKGGELQYVNIDSDNQMRMNMNNESAIIETIIAVVEPPSMCFAFGNVTEMNSFCRAPWSLVD